MICQKYSESIPYGVVLILTAYNAGSYNALVTQYLKDLRHSRVNERASEKLLPKYTKEGLHKCCEETSTPGQVDDQCLQQVCVSVLEPSLLVY